MSARLPRVGAPLWVVECQAEECGFQAATAHREDARKLAVFHAKKRGDQHRHFGISKTHDFTVPEELL